MKLINNKRICRTFHWDAAHNLVLPYDSKCVNIHGHTYLVAVTIEGQLDKNGMVLDFSLLKEWVETASFDHKYLNENIKSFKSKNPTAENLVEYLYDSLNNFDVRENLSIPRDIKIVKIRVWETPTSFAEVEW